MFDIMSIRTIIFSLLQRNTFQCVITTDGTTSFAIFLYNKIEWTTGPARVGFNEGAFNNRIIIIIVLQIKVFITCIVFTC